MNVMIIHRGVDADPKCARLIDILHEQGCRITFIGWDVNPWVAKPQFSKKIYESHIMVQPAAFGIGALTKFPRFIFFIFKLLMEKKPDVVHCINEEVALLVLAWKKTLFDKLVLDVFDSLHLRISFRLLFVNRLLAMVCNLTYSFADLIIVTNRLRYDLLHPRYQRKTIIIENTLDTGAIEPTTGGKKGSDDKIRVCVSGSICLIRGIKTLLEAVEGNGGVEIVAVGILQDQYAEETFAAHPQVTFHGFQNQQTALRLASGCDALFAYYAPTNQNNIYASPNKIFDAMYVGIPIIINAEAKISRWVEENKLGFAVPYYDHQALAKVIQHLKSGDSERVSLGQRAKKMFEEEYSFTIMKERLIAGYRRLFADIRQA